MDSFLQLSENSDQMEAILSMPSPSGMLPIHCAAGANQWSLVDLLLDQGQDGGICDSNGLNLFHYAVTNGRPDIVSKLLDRLPASDANAKEANYGSSPLRLAITEARSQEQKCH